MPAAVEARFRSSAALRSATDKLTQHPAPAGRLSLHPRGPGLNALRTVIADLLRAALVLALVALSFSHVAPARSDVPDSSTQWSLASASDLCGDFPGGGGGSHAPCHACRIWAGVDLPPPPATALACSFAIARVDFAERTEPATAPTPGLLPRSRAPPALN